MNDMERALVGAVLSGWPDVPSLTRLVSPQDFYDPHLEKIWRACIAVHSAGDPVTPLSVKDHMGSALRDPLQLTELTQAWGPEDPQWLAEKVRGQSIMRKVSEHGHRLLQMQQDPDADPQELVADIRKWADEASTPRVGLRLAGTALERVIDIAEHGEPAAIPVPWRALGELVEGWYPGQLVTFGARPGSGKTLALENLAYDAAAQGRFVLFASLEMREEELVQRTLAHVAGVPLQRLRNGSATEKDWANINRATPSIEALPLVIVDDPRQTVEDIRAEAWEARQMAKRAGSELALIVVDYVQLITPVKRLNGESRQQVIGEITRALKRLAREMEVPVITAAQLNRQNQNRSHPVPVLADLREAGDIENDSDVVIFLHPETVEQNGRTEETDEISLVVAKQRSGPLGVRTIYRSGHYARLYDHA